MKKFNASDLSKKPSQVFAAAREDGAIIQHKDRQGKVVEEFVLISKGYIDQLDIGDIVFYNNSGSHLLKG